MFVLIFPQRARHARGGRVAELREAGEWQKCARQASGRAARGGRVAELREAGEWQMCARRASGRAARGGRVATVRELFRLLINLLMVFSSYLQNAYASVTV